MTYRQLICRRSMTRSMSRQWTRIGEETMSVSEDVVGVSFNISAAQAQYDAAENGDTIVIPLIFTEPAVTTESLNDLLFRDVLSEKSTSLSGSSGNRINNITLAAAAINGTVLNPGDTFSYNGTLGERRRRKDTKRPALCGRPDRPGSRRRNLSGLVDPVLLRAVRGSGGRGPIEPHVYRGLSAPRTGCHGQLGARSTSSLQMIRTTRSKSSPMSVAVI